MTLREAYDQAVRDVDQRWVEYAEVPSTQAKRKAARWAKYAAAQKRRHEAFELYAQSVRSAIHERRATP